MIGEDYVKDLMQLQKLNDLVDDDEFLRDVAKVKQVWTHTMTIYTLPQGVCTNCEKALIIFVCLCSGQQKEVCTVLGEKVPSEDKSCLYV